MKFAKRTFIIAIALFAVLAMPLHLGAQEHHANHHQYQFVDLGTLGGPNSYLPLLSLSQNGTFAGSADTTTPDPYGPSFCNNNDCFVSHAITWRNGTLTDLGVLPGPAGSSSMPTWISKNGLIAGFSLNGQIDPLFGAPEIRAVLWQNDVIADLGTLEGGFESGASAVNNSGQVVGFATNLVPDPNSIAGITTQSRAFLWEKGVMQDLGTLPGGTDAEALFINERGQIVGQSYAADSIVTPPIGCGDSPLTLYSFSWENGVMTDMGTLGGHCATPYSLNNRGQVVGQSNLTGDTLSHPFLWQPGKKMKDLGTLGGTYGFAAWLNDAGTVVGDATNEGDQALLGFFWEKGTITNLGALPGNACSAADAINSRGQIVGGSGGYNAQNVPACTDLVEHAVLWENGQILDLNAFVPPGSDLTLSEATFINDRGEISGIGTLSNGDQHAFLLIPCDENHPDHEGCQDADAGSTATRLSSAPAMQRPPNAVRQLLGQRLGFGRFAESPQKAALNGKTAIAAPIATLSPTSLTFSAQALGTTSPAKTVTLKNTGTATLTIVAVAITGTDAGDFAQTHTCGSSLAPGASCGIRVTFKPSASGTRTADLSVTDNAAGTPQHVPLSGIGTTAKLSPASLSFGTVAIGTASPVKTITLTNVGTTTLTITAIAITGTNAGDFVQTHTCSSSLAAGASCTISVAFKPTQIGKRTGALSVTDNAPGSPQAVSLGGTGKGTHVELVPNQLSFECSPLRNVCSCQTVRSTTLTNVGSTTLNISSITTSDPFSESNTCGASVAAGSSCNVHVFWDRITGNGAVSISDNGRGSPQMVPLSGDNHCSP
jgi:probable HAF family extracellular repeat protein